MGDFTENEVFEIYQEGELIRADKTFTEHQTEKQEETPTMTESPIKATNKTDDKSTLSSIKSMIGLGDK